MYIKKEKSYQQKGFALIEILTALFLISMIMIAIPLGMGDSSRDKLEDAIDDLDRAVRFATNESILKNAIVRLRLDLEKKPVEYYVEVAPSGQFVIRKEIDTSRLSLKEKKYLDQKQESIDSKFNKVNEFKETTRELSEEVTILGLANSEDKKIKKEGNLNIYFYPSGERDSALLLFGTDQEVAALDILPFQDKTKLVFMPINTDADADADAEVYDIQMNKAEEILQEWIKN
ncbi:prepilin-type N-terminal cleavage/methylation domain-containing protein [Bacteriovoracaceae bacterium]|nr:prepilin-type N-terminal cleavage/methylation domain-containing protein [Bacteriovoracaceae bacterium]